MTEFKEKINEVLKSLNYSFDDLAGHLGMNSEQLNQAIDDKKVELRTLEFISKELRIPLYSFLEMKILCQSIIYQKNRSILIKLTKIRLTNCKSKIYF
jgi:transcriptional regulator with XRE-family HTH domain